MVDWDEVDTDKLFSTIIILLIIIVVIIGGIYYFVKQSNDSRLAPFVKVCSNNPKLRYETNCSNSVDCINKCAEKQYSISKKS